MSLIQNLMEAYHMPFHEAMRLTLPQIVMLNHAAYVTHENAERKAKARRDLEDVQGSASTQHYPGFGDFDRPAAFDQKDPIVDASGKRLSELEQDPDELFNYLRGFKDMV